MFPTSVHRLLRRIASFKDGNPHLTLSPQVEARIRILEMELGFLKTFIWCSQHESLRKSGIGAAIRTGKRKLNLYGSSCADSGRLDRAVCGFLREIELCKQKIRQDCFRLLDFTNWCKFSSTSELLRYLNSVIHNLKNLVRFKASAIISVRLQVNVLIKKLRLFRDFVNSTGQKVFFSLDIQGWACKITIISVLFWVDQLEEATVARLKACLVDLVFQSYSPELIRLYLGALKASKLASPEFDHVEMGKFIESFIYFILPIGYVNIIGAELMFLIACVMDPPREKMDAEEEAAWSFILTKSKEVASEIPSLIRSLTVREMNENIAVLGDFRQKTGKVMAEVRKFYTEILESTSHCFSVTNALGTMDSPMETFGNLMEKLISKSVIHIPFSKDQFLSLHKELVSLMPLLKKIQELEEPMDLWMRISEVAYHVGYIIDVIPSKGIPIWYSFMFISDVIEDVKSIRREIEVINHEQRHTSRRRILNVAADMNFGNRHIDLSHTDDAIIGFNDEAEKIIDRLITGQEKLDIVAIVGMPGQGKTTLAKKVYNSPLVQYHFNKFAWCFVTQIYQVKKLLLDLLRDINNMHGDEILTMSQEDLAEKLYKCLKGRKFLIILDDIWDITAWNAIKVSFPDDNNGSRILFTSRNKFCGDSFPLCPLSEKESMELLKHKLLLNGVWPSNFSGDVQKILRICNGLPLAIVVIASLLKRVSNNLGQWRELVQNLCSALPSEGCMDILELSYNSLPDFLKPCFLYLAAVVTQTKVFKVQKAIQLWIAEGFVQKSGIKSLEAVAIEYLEDLVGRNLVIVHKRSFTNGVIKECLIHDLFYELCSRKVEEEKVMHFLKVSPYSSKIINYGAHCLRLYSGWMADSWQENACEIVPLIAPKTASPVVHSLLFSPGFHVQKDLLSFIYKLKFVRVLDMWSVNLNHGFPEEIVCLSWLRYLAISFAEPFIPLSICNLSNLESFHVFCISTVDFPHTIWKMKALKNINFILDGINMVLDATVCYRLENLDTLSVLCLYNGEDADSLLRGFPRVRKLRLKFEFGWKCRRDCRQFQVLKSLKNLESLKLKHSCESIHTCALNFPATLKILSISYFCHPLNELSPIGKLPNLEVLKLWHHHNEEREEQSWEVGDDEFVSLKVLKLGGFKISHWEVPTSSFQCLDRLVLKYIHYLDELPTSFEDVMTLKMIQLQRCRRRLSTSAMSILSAQRDIGNEELKILVSDELEEYSMSWRLGYSFLSHLYPAKRRQDKDRLLEQKQKISHRTEDDHQRAFGLDKKDVTERCVACFQKRHVLLSTRRTKHLPRHNCQARQAIMFRHYKEELKRDGHGNSSPTESSHNLKKKNPDSF